MTNDEALKPCPLCGSCDLQSETGPGIQNGPTRIYCNQCDAGAPIGSWQGRDQPASDDAGKAGREQDSREAAELQGYLFEHCRDVRPATAGLMGWALAALAQPASAEPVAEVTNKFGDPEAFAERELQADSKALQALPIGTKLYAHPPAPAALDVDLARKGFWRGFEMARCVPGCHDIQAAWADARPNLLSGHARLSTPPAPAVPDLFGLKVVVDSTMPPDGWKLVPVEPTLEMWGAADNAYIEHNIAVRLIGPVWSAMLAAAPKP